MGGCKDGCTCGRHREGKPFDASLTYDERKRAHETPEQREHHRAGRKAYYQVNREVMLGRAGEYYTKNRDEILVTNRRKYNENREHYRLQRRIWVANNPEKAKESDRVWSKKNRLAHPGITVKEAERQARRRAKLKAGEGFTHDERHAYWEAKDIDPKVCTYCDLHIENWETSQADHVIPLTRSGTHTLDNVMPCCFLCNCSKNDRLLYVEWTPLNMRLRNVS